MLDSYAMTVIGKSRSDNTDNFCLNDKIRFDAADKYLAAWDEVTHKKNLYAIFSGKGSDDMAATASYIGASVASKNRKKNLTADFAAFAELLNSEICDYIMHCDGVRVALCAAFLRICGKSAFAYNIGGGAVYLLRRGKLKKLVNRNDGFAGKFGEEGSCGFEKSDEIVLEDGDLFVVCNEQILNCVSEKELADMLRNADSAKKAAAAIVRKAIDGGAEEALTVAAVMYSAKERKQKTPAKIALMIGGIAAAAAIAVLCILKMRGSF